MPTPKPKGLQDRVAGAVKAATAVGAKPKKKPAATKEPTNVAPLYVNAVDVDILSRLHIATATEQNKRGSRFTKGQAIQEAISLWLEQCGY